MSPSANNHPTLYSTTDQPARRPGKRGRPRPDPLDLVLPVHTRAGLDPAAVAWLAQLLHHGEWAQGTTPPGRVGRLRGHAGPRAGLVGHDYPGKIRDRQT
jgi:hypothetical protein